MLFEALIICWVFNSIKFSIKISHIIWKWKWNWQCAAFNEYYAKQITYQRLWMRARFGACWGLEDGGNNGKTGRESGEKMIIGTHKLPENHTIYRYLFVGLRSVYAVPMKNASEWKLATNPTETIVQSNVIKFIGLTCCSLPWRYLVFPLQLQPYKCFICSTSRECDAFISPAMWNKCENFSISKLLLISFEWMFYALWRKIGS